MTTLREGLRVLSVPCFAGALFYSMFVAGEAVSSGQVANLEGLELTTAALLGIGTLFQVIAYKLK